MWWGFVCVCLFSLFSHFLYSDQNMFPFPVPTTLKHCSPTGTLFPQPRRLYFSLYRLPCPLSIWDLKYLLFSSVPWEGVLWNACAGFCPLSASGFISAPSQRDLSASGDLTGISCLIQSARPLQFAWLCEVNVNEVPVLHWYSVLLPALLVCFSFSKYSHSKQRSGYCYFKTMMKREKNVSSPWNQRISDLSSDDKKSNFLVSFKKIPLYQIFLLLCNTCFTCLIFH